MLMDNAGYVPAPKGAAATAAMTQRLAEGMNSAFWMIGIYLIVVGLISVLLLNPDRTALRLQERFAYNG